MNDNKNLIKLLAKVELARHNFYYYCKLMYPDFYTKDRTYLKVLCDNIQDFWENGDENLLIINCPPRIGKSFTVQNWEAFQIGRNPKEQIISISYNKHLSTNFSKNVRNKIGEIKYDKESIVFSDIFNVKLKNGSTAAESWAVDGNELQNFLAAGPGSTITGMGGNIIIDDLIRDNYEAYNENILDKHWSFFTDTLLSRIENGQKCVLIFTRWNQKDLAGRLIDLYKEKGFKYRHVVMKAEDENGNSICESLLPKSRIAFLKSIMSEEIWEANYMQNPISTKGRLYTRFNIYEKEDIKNIKFEYIISCCDSADEGDDYCANIIAGIHKRKIYLLDVIYTKAHMENTEVMIADALKKFEVNLCRIESNNGGRGFARNIDRLSKELKNNITQITTFTQNKNKNARIYSNRNNIMSNVFYPAHWDALWPEFFKSIVEYQAEGKNKNDDAEDALTLVYESFQGLGYYNY